MRFTTPAMSQRRFPAPGSIPEGDLYARRCAVAGIQGARPDLAEILPGLPQPLRPWVEEMHSPDSGCNPAVAADFSDLLVMLQIPACVHPAMMTIP